MKRPEWLTLQVGIAIGLAFVLAGAVFYVMRLREKAVSFDNVVGALETTENSAEISRQAGEAASQSNQEHQHEVYEDRAAVSAVRRATATAADHARLQQRIDEAYARGLCAERRLQRKDCGTELPAAPGD